MWEQGSVIYKLYANDKENICKLKNFKTKGSHIAKTFSKLRRKSPFLFPVERRYIQRFDQVMPQMTGFYILSPWVKVFCIVIRNIIENYCTWTYWPLLCVPVILTAVSSNHKIDIGKFCNIKLFSKWQRDFTQE